MKKFNKLFVMLIILLVGLLSSCVMPQVSVTRTLTSIEVEKAESITQGVIGEFKITDLDLKLIYSDGITEYIDITESMIGTSDLGKLQMPGTHSLILTYNNLTTVFNITMIEVTSENVDEFIENFIKQTTVQAIANDDFVLPKSNNGVTITWTSNNTSSIVIFGSNAVVTQGNEDVNVILTGTFTYKGVTKTQNYTVKVEKEEPKQGSSTYEGTYYDDVDLTLTGNALKAVLRELLQDTHKVYTSYKDCKTKLPYVDEDLTNSNNMILFYTGQSIVKSQDLNNDWNREHVWPKSLGWFEETGAGSDLHHIRPCKPSLNSSRGNKKFGTSTNSNYFCPDDSYKGDVARIIFYLMVAYNEADRYSFTSVAQSLTMLLDWNELDPVSEAEIVRNDKIEVIQGNRNPFIDYPELADQIW
jgi:endonuclease I